MSTTHATGVINGITYKVVEDGNGSPHKVIDFDQLEKDGLLPREGSVLIESVLKSNKRKGVRTQFKACTDKESGIRLGIYKGNNPRTKELDWFPIFIENGTVFNLEIKDDAQKAFVILRSNLIEGSPNQSEYYKLTMFRVHDEMKAAVNTLRKIEASQRAISVAQSLYGPDLEDMARNLGMDLKYTNETIRHAEVVRRAYENPHEFLRIYDNPNRESITIFNKALTLGIITHTPHTGYHYNGSPLGINESFVCDYFIKHPATKSAIDMLCQDKAKLTKASNAPKVNEKAELEKRLAEVLAENARLKNQAPVSEDLAAELETWKERAKEIGGVIVQGINGYVPTRESIDKLIAKVTAANRLKEQTT